MCVWSQEKYQREQEKLKQEWEQSQKEVEEEERRYYEEVRFLPFTDLVVSVSLWLALLEYLLPFKM